MFIRYDKDTILDFILLSGISFSAIKYAFSEILGLFIEVPYHLDSIFLWLIFGVLFILPQIRRFKFTKDVVILGGVLAFSWLATLSFQQEYSSEWLREAYKIFVRAFPYYLVARAVREYDRLEKHLEITMRVIVIAVLIVMAIKSRQGTMERYDMTLAYMIYPASIIAFPMLYNKFTFSNLLFFALACILLIFNGTRGPLACLIFWMLIYLIMKLKKPNKTNVFFLLLGSMILAFSILNLSLILQFLEEKAESLGVSVRVISSIKTGNFFESLGRIKIYQAALNVLMTYPLTGVGIITERRLISELLQGDKQFLGSYPHLIFLELIVQFGIIIGTILCIYLISSIIKRLKRNETVYKRVWCLFFAIGFLPLLFSGSYLESEAFFLFLGLTMNGRMLKE